MRRAFVDYGPDADGRYQGLRYIDQTFRFRPAPAVRSLSSNVREGSNPVNAGDHSDKMTLDLQDSRFCPERR
jgi:hypothetical protein